MSEQPPTYRIRPAGRHLLTIGRDLIQDEYAAIVELVKNAFDADSPEVTITFQVPPSRNKLVLIIEDQGHGMTRDTVINEWLVPSTEDKLRRRESPQGRLMQGRKGIGRYAASVLGADLLLETVTEHGEKTVVYLEWKHFLAAKYLDEVELLVETSRVNESKGTRLTISGDQGDIASWDQEQIDKLEYELKKFTSPIATSDRVDDFKIYLQFDGFWKNAEENIKRLVEPYPIVDYYDYSISGTIEPNGKGLLIYRNQKARNTIEEPIEYDNKEPTGCGQLTFDIKVYDRERAAMEQLIERGLKDSRGNYLGILQAKQMLDKYNGIGVYRNGFRIRPLGDADFDWLKLNKQRIQNPSKKIGSNQVIGYVLIQSEENSNLQEKSARDGQRENLPYRKLIKITQEVINKLEDRRFIYRSKAGLSRLSLKVEREIERLFTFEEIKQGVRRSLARKDVSEKDINEVVGLIEKKEADSNKLAEDIRQTVAIYQGQATLGKIINVILHEGRRPLSYFKNQIPNIQYWSNQFKQSADNESLREVVTASEGIGRNADFFVKLFSRLDPLAAGKRADKKSIDIVKTIKETFDVFKSELQTNKISFDVKTDGDIRFDCWIQDIYAIMTNLIDNSIYWIVEKKSPEKRIDVIITVTNGELAYIDYRDSGPGIEKHLIESEVIFEPEFSTKPDGTGLGLAIAGEAANRNGLHIKAFESNSGAYFRLQPVQE